MSVFRWIELLLLHWTAVAREATFIAVRDGNDATLSCKHLIQDQERCDSTTWVFRGLGDTPAVEMVRLGQIYEYPQDTSDRLSFTEDCSLVIKKVTLKDVGTYVCEQCKLGKQQESDGVDLSVATMTEHKNNNEVTLNCSVTSYKELRHTVEWLHVDHDVDTNDNNDVKASKSDASASVTLTNLHHKSDHLELFMCKVTDIYTKQVQLFTFSSQTSGEKPARTHCSVVDYIMLVLRVAELVLVTVITVLLIRAPGNQRPPNDDTAHHDEDDVSVSYENIDGPSASVFTGQQRRHQLRTN